VKPETKEKVKENKYSLSAVIVAIATAIGGMAECQSNETQAQNAENIRVASDEALLKELEQLRASNEKYKEFANEIGEELDELHEKSVTCQQNDVELEIRVGVLERLGPNDVLVRDALVEELDRLAEEENTHFEPPADFTEDMKAEEKAEEVAEKVVSEKTARKKKKKRVFDFAPPDPPAPAAELLEQIQQKAY